MLLWSCKYIATFSNSRLAFQCLCCLLDAFDLHVQDGQPTLTFMRCHGSTAVHKFLHATIQPPCTSPCKLWEVYMLLKLVGHVQADLHSAPPPISGSDARGSASAPLPLNWV